MHSNQIVSSNGKLYPTLISMHKLILSISIYIQCIHAVLDTGQGFHLSISNYLQQHTYIHMYIYLCYSGCAFNMSTFSID